MRFEPVKGIVAGGKEIPVVNPGASFTAIGNRCAHRGYRLSSGKMDGETFHCPCQGSMFNDRTGYAVRGPATRPEPASAVTGENGVFFPGV
jgi:nitrite reductase/ring-hydroxylating ferredoxin subunit